MTYFMPLNARSRTAKVKLMRVLRTPDARFEGLADYPFEPHYTEIDTDEGASLRIHHIDEGDPNAPLVMLLHGQPIWSYLYRKMVPLLAGFGLRIIAPDLPGYGKSDKPAAREDFTYQRQVDWMGRWLEANDFEDITLFGQDWGGLIGLRMVVDHPDRFTRVMGNTGLPLNTSLDQQTVDRVMAFRQDGERISFPGMVRAISRLGVWGRIRCLPHGLRALAKVLLEHAGYARGFYDGDDDRCAGHLAGRAKSRTASLSRHGLAPHHTAGARLRGTFSRRNVQNGSPGDAQPGADLADGPISRCPASCLDILRAIQKPFSACLPRTTP